VFHLEEIPELMTHCPMEHTFSTVGAGLLEALCTLEKTAPSSGIRFCNHKDRIKFRQRTNLFLGADFVIENRSMMQRNSSVDGGGTDHGHKYLHPNLKV
jgi:hypothetical protein